mgnify:FL=1
MFDQFQIIGHRGWAAKYPENTLLGFQKAVDAGATMIELDVQLTSDNHLVVFHDETAKRLCDRDLKLALTSRENIKSLKVQDNDIPFLDQVFESFGENINYYIELKTFQTTLEDEKLKLAFYTVNEILKHSLRRNCVVASFDTDLLRACRRMGFNNLGVNYDKGVKDPNFKLGCSYHKLIKDKVTEPTFAWTVNNAKRMKTLINNKVDGIVTDHVDKLVNICKDQLVAP